MDIRHLTSCADQPVKAAQSPEQFWGLPKRGVAFLLANVMFWQPVWAQADGIVVSAPGTSLGVAGNGVPIVQIAAPNAAGLSHNQFQDYNVGANGVILNNATLRTQSTQLGGIILGNPNLNGTAAQIILNEVNGGRPSQLNGYTEVAGQSARVIVANPYGISCSGCGFINTPRVTLTTGKPVLNGAGGLDHYQVDGGSISIDGAGLNADNVDSFEIITRSAKINADIQANNLSIIAGRNDVNAQTLNATPRTDDGSLKPQLAIDSAALGGMYANTIRLVGTEAGVGVRLAGNLAASGGDIQISANGQLSLAQTAATGAINVNAASLETQGPVYAGTALNIQTQGGLTNQQSLAARDSINLSSGGLLTNNGIIESGINADNSRNSSGDVNLSAQSISNTGHSMIASRNLAVSAAQNLNNQGGTLSARNSANLTTGSLDNRSHGQVLSSGNLSLNTQQLLNSQGLISAAGGLGLSVLGDFANQGGTLIADSDLWLNAGSVDNTAGQIASKGNLGAQVGALSNLNGQLIAQGALSLGGSTLDNRQNGLVAATHGIQVSVATIDNRGGELSSAAGVTVTGQQLDNSQGGRVLAGAGLNLGIQHISNSAQGLLSGTTGVSLSGSSLDNSAGSLRSQRDLSVTLSGDLTNSGGLLSSEGLLTVSAASVANRLGSLSSAGQLSLFSAGSIDNQGGQLVTDGGLNLSSGNLDNSQGGSISGKGALNLSTGTFNNNTSNLSSGSTLTLSAGQVSNQSAGRIASAGALSASVTGLDQQGGQLFSNTSLTLDLNHGQLNNANGLITAPLLMLNNLQDVGNQNGEISSAQAFTLTANSLDNSNGNLLSSQALTLRINQALINVKGLIAAAALDVHAVTLDNSGGTLTSRADLNLSVDGQLTNQNQGLINATTALTISSAGLNNQNGSLLGSAIALDFGTATGDLNNMAGLITSDGQLSIQHLRDLSNQGGEISSQQSFSLAGRNLDNRSGKLISSQLLSVDAAKVNNQDGLISGWNSLQVSAADLDNRNNGTLSSRNGDLLLDVSGSVLNNGGGAVVTQKQLTINASDLDNSQGGILSSGGGQTLTVAGLLNNSQGGLIDSGAGLSVHALTLGNAAGVINAQQDLIISGTSLDNSSGRLAGNGAVTLNLLGVLTNTNGQLASAGPLLIQHTSQIDNQGGQIASQSLLTLLTGGLDNRNRGTVAASGSLLLTASGAVQNDSDGLIYSQHADLQLHAASLTNSHGALQSQDTLGLDVTGDIDNHSGRIIAQDGDLTLNAGNVDSRGGVLASLQGALTALLSGLLNNGVDLDNNSQGGITQAQRLDLSALGGIDNSGGRLSAQTGDIVIHTAGFDNRNGGLYAAGRINVTGSDFDNSSGGQVAARQIDLSLSGALNNRQGVLESDSTLAISAASLDNQTGQLRALGTSGTTNFQIGGLFDNQNGTLETANTDLTLNAASFLNTGGSLLHVGTGTFDISTANVIGAGGTLVTRGGLTLTADSWNNSNVIQAGRLTVNVNNFSQTGSGQLLASDSFIGTGGTWYNDGLIASDGTLDLNLGGTYWGNGRLSSLGALDVRAAQIGLSTTASIVGGSDTTLTVGGALNNYGRLTSTANLAIVTGSLSNYGTLASGQDLTVSTGSLLNDHGLISSGGDMQLFASSFTNSYAQVYGFGNVLIAGNVQGGMADLLDNRSGNIESVLNLTINAMTVNNVMDVLQYGHVKSKATITQLPCELIPGPGCDERGWGGINGLWQIDETDTLQVTNSSAASGLTSGADLLINAQTLNNLSSTIAASGNLTANATTINNTGLQTQDITTTRTYWNYVTQIGQAIAAAANFNAKNSPTPSATVEADLSAFLSWMGGGLLTHNSTVSNTGDSSYAAIIQAGGSVNLNATQTINNSVVRPYYAYVTAGHTNTDTGAGSAYATHVTINAQLPPNLAQQQVNPTTLPGFSLPTGQNGLFRLSGQDTSTASSGPQNWSVGGAVISNAQRQQSLPGGQPSTIDPRTSGSGASSFARVQGVPSNTGHSNPQKYLIETNPALTDLKQFMSSDYLLGNLGYNPDDSAKRLGDGFYEQQLIQRAIVAGTGQRFIDGMTSDEAQFKYLMDNALASKNQLNLSLGVSLTAEQVAALTHDIVWMESEVVDGQTVLVPVLYLANANNRLAPNGALIQGSDVTLIAGEDLNNVGTLKATHNLQAAASNNLVNSGLIEAGNRLDLLAGNDLTNKAGGIIAGRDVSLTTISGDVINERTVTSHNASGNGVSQQRDFVDSAGRIEAANNLNISAGRDVNNVGGVLQSGRDTTISAGRDVNFTSAQQTVSNDYGTHRYDQSITQYGSSVSVGQDLSIQAGRDVTAIASQIDAQRDVSLSAGRDVTLASAANEQHSYNKTDKDTSQEDHVHQVGSGINAGGNVTLSAGQDLTLISSKVNAGDEAYLSAGNQLSMLAAQDSDYSLYDMHKKGSWGSKKTQRDEVTDVENVGSEIKTGGNLTLVSGGDQLYQAAKLDSGKDITLDSGGSITFEAVKDLHDESHTKSDSNLAWQSSEGKGNTDETLRQSQLVAQGQLTIKAVDGLHVDIKQIDQKTVSQAIDVMVQADPSLVWLKDAEARGDVDWRQVQEVHDSFKYDNSGLGPAAQLAIAILVTYLTWGAGSTLVGAAADSAGGIAANSVAAAVATKAATSTVNNRGNLGAVAKDVTSSDSLKGYVIAGVSGGIGNADIALQLAVNSALKTVLQGGKFKDNLAQAAVMMAADALSGYLYQNVGNALNGSGLATKVAVHALVGGLIGEAAGGDFRTAALAAGANEALLEMVGNQIFPGDAHARVVAMTSQLVGMTVAAAAGGSAKDQEKAGWVAQQAAVNNYLQHDEVDKLAQELVGCRANPDPVACRGQVQDKYQALNDSKTGAGLNDCKKGGEGACYDQYAAVEDGSAKLDSLLNSFTLNDAEKDVLEHFQSINHDEERVAHDAWLQPFLGESGVIGGALIGGAAALAAAERAAATKAAGAAGAVDQATTGIAWGKGIQSQGLPWEDYLGTQLPAGSRLPPNFKTFDFFDETTGIATSAKTLDTTTAAKIANPSQVYSSLKGNIDAAANFVESGLKGVTVNSSQITARELQVAIPKATTNAQWVQINKAIEYGQSKGITVKITKVN
ncbi:two-partner secretion domain-containing protein [Pseudomonas sp. OV226]|uniref:two-partner secretion domain-containing protein n=1 Tax=Pseudomonas sp. OV226 TaxID=2135588 RepID=UPI000D6AFF8F|nr:hemagglutinin repeat-containing protein [Pseudomonas sp. OV226]PWK43233.1 filamentous hemagglutinin [Pseudomonas sp. OV226]